MEAFNNMTGTLAPLPAANIDTDVIMPKQFLKGIDRKNLDRGVFFDLRFLPDGRTNPAFILNQAGWENATFLLVGANFGCGSSREHAVWGLNQLGIRAIIGTSFAGIFDDNCQRNGVLTLTLSEEDYQRLSEVANNAASNRITVSLEQQAILFDNQRIAFSVSALKREMLLGGGSAVDWTLQYESDITQFEAQHFSQRPWLKRDQIQQDAPA
ncbi:MULTISPECIES: 3-isopropylmalate dehydratase small subunit [unclassified Pantoea]|uniref:3-isopropylmalate dehydratase small subunit n=1 Tax=unclassified Pantoea TaxID=2630326 RepID=UPI0024531A20|nr:MULTISPECIES: 3-isopropylmalate dehydratase small subunit [unclassified Pantoea]MDR6353013.1 3-isopropylmalate/(R)-2-methylmalate dehydratase small subunit [Pantoea sp. SORGH_AS_0659]WGK59641.1 3-isopropylmalate dehydratase small subunit [Pantoea sp. SS70]